MDSILLHRIIKDVERTGAKDYNIEIVDLENIPIPINSNPNIIDVSNAIVYVFEKKGRAMTSRLESFENLVYAPQTLNKSVDKFLTPIILSEMESVKYIKVNLIR